MQPFRAQKKDMSESVLNDQTKRSCRRNAGEADIAVRKHERCSARKGRHGMAGAQPTDEAGDEAHQSRGHSPKQAHASTQRQSKAAARRRTLGGLQAFIGKTIERQCESGLAEEVDRDPGAAFKARARISGADLNEGVFRRLPARLLTLLGEGAPRLLRAPLELHQRVHR